MANLHLIRSHNTEALNNFFSFKQADDILLLLDDGVYFYNHEKVLELVKNHESQQLYLIGEHLSARGLNSQDYIPQKAFTNIDQMVELTLKTDKVINWS